MGINMKKSCRIAYDFALEHAGGKALERRRKIDCTYTDKGWLEDLLFVTGQLAGDSILMAGDDAGEF